MSGIIANYLTVIMNQQEKSEIEITPLVKSMKGSFSAPLNFNYKKELAKGLAEKYQSITNEGIYTKTMMWSNIENGEIPQFVVAGGCGSGPQ